MLRAYKTELRPNNKQRTQFVKCCGVARFVFNWALSDREERYKRGEKTTMYEQTKRFNALKDEQFPWIRGVPYKVMESAFSNCDHAFQNFFRQIKNGEKDVGFPKFKSKKKGLGNFALRGSIHVNNESIELPRLGKIRLKENGYLPVEGVKILSATVSERASHWFISVQVEESDKPKPQVGEDVIGIDMGVKTLAVCSNGDTFDNPKSLYNYEQRLAHLQRGLSRKEKGSKNRKKAKAEVAKLHYRISNIRSHSLNRVSSYLTKEVRPKAIVIEDLNVAGMLQNRHLSKAIADAAFSELGRQLGYKCQWNGINLVIANRFYPSSKRCSACGSVKPQLKLSERRFVCPECGAIMDRDYNASLNLEEVAQ